MWHVEFTSGDPPRVGLPSRYDMSAIASLVPSSDLTIIECYHTIRYARRSKAFGSAPRHLGLILHGVPNGLRFR
jgi:hypothetical protein